MNNRGSPKIRRLTDLTSVALALFKRLDALEETVREQKAELDRLNAFIACHSALVDFNPPETGSKIELKRR